MKFCPLHKIDTTRNHMLSKISLSEEENTFSLLCSTITMKQKACDLTAIFSPCLYSCRTEVFLIFYLLSTIPSSVFKPLIMEGTEIVLLQKLRKKRKGRSLRNRTGREGSKVIFWELYL